MVGPLFHLTTSPEAPVEKRIKYKSIGQILLEIVRCKSVHNGNETAYNLDTLFPHKCMQSQTG